MKKLVEDISIVQRSDAPQGEYDKRTYVTKKVYKEGSGTFVLSKKALEALLLLNLMQSILSMTKGHLQIHQYDSIT